MERIKDSGFTFIGDVPASWDIVRLNTVADLFGRIGWQGLTSDEYSDEGAWLVTGTDLVNGTVSWDSCVHVPDKRWVEAWQIQLKQGDVLITKDGTVGKVAVVDNLPGHSSLNSGVMRVVRKGRGFDPHYLYYVLQSDVFKGWFEDVNAGASTIQHLFQGDFNHFVFPWPSLEEQAHISGFLSEATSALDNEMEILEQQISTLERYKASLIHEAVTKGLDPSVPTKPSGVEWIGDIPEHWTCPRVKYVASISSGSTPNRSNWSFWDGEVPWVKTGELANSVLSETEECVTRVALRNCSLELYPKDTILVAMYGQGKTRGMTAKLGVPCTINQACAALSARKGVIAPDYLWVCLMGGYDSLRAIAQGSGQPNLSADLIGNYRIAVPPDLDEQTAIASYVLSHASKIDAILDIKHKQIDVLKRRRQSLIYEYVTGKRRVFQEA